MYKLILIDADDTIFDYNKAEEYALFSSLDKFRFGGDYQELREKYSVINKNLWLELEKGTISKDELRLTRFARLFENDSIDFDASDFSEYYLKRLGEGSFLIDGALNVLQYLREKYKVVIITNGIREVQESRLEGSEVKKYISDMIISEAVGVNKPDPYIFEYTFKKVNFDNKKEAIMIGDSLSSDIQGGINFGIDTCWFNIAGIENKSGLVPTYTISNIKELENIL